MSHANHTLSSQTIWHDNCPECTERAARLPSSLGDLDGRNRIRAWHYMRAYRWSGGNWRTDPPSVNDRKLFDCLYTIAVFMERAGIRPDDVEWRMIEEHDRLVAQVGMGEPIGHELNGIDITGIFVKP